MHMLPNQRIILSLLFLTIAGMFAGFRAPLLAHDHDDDERHENELRSLPPVTNAKWKEECSSCHTPFHPGLLPERSWKKMMAGLADHFGDDASLDAKTRDEITSFLASNSSDRGASRRAAKIHRSIPSSDTPLRITETLYFKRKHDEISSKVWKRPKVGSPANCAACHGSGAEKGTFDEEFVRIPPSG